MLKRTIALSLPLLLAASALHAEIYECVDEFGNKRFTNIKAEAKGCKAMKIVPPAPPPAKKPEAKPGPKSDAKPAAKPGANFPRVDPETQRDRDAERRRILEQELAREQKMLDKARSDLAAQESVRLGSERNYQRVLDRLEPYKKQVKLHENNVANLQRELANLR